MGMLSNQAEAHLALTERIGSQGLLSYIACNPLNCGGHLGLITKQHLSNFHPDNSTGLVAYTKDRGVWKYAIYPKRPQDHIAIEGMDQTPP